MNRKRNRQTAHSAWFEDRLRASIRLRNDAHESDLSSSFFANLMNALPATPDAITKPNRRRLWGWVIGTVTALGTVAAIGITIVVSLPAHVFIEETNDGFWVIPDGGLASALDFLSGLYATTGSTDLFALILILATFGWCLSTRQPISLRDA